MGIGTFLSDLIFHFAVQGQLHRVIAMRTYRIDRNRQGFISQLPLHEGRGNRIHRSGGI